MAHRPENDLAAHHATRAAAHNPRLAREAASESTAYAAWLREDAELRRWEWEAAEWEAGYRLWAESLQPEPPEPAPCEWCGKSGWHKRDCY